VVREIELRVKLAFELLELIVASRLSLAEYAVEHGPAHDGTTRMTFPIRFEIGAAGISEQAANELRALGLEFVSRPTSQAPGH
jgi:hypothetical protein